VEDTLADETAGDHARVEGPRQSRVGDLDALEAPAPEQGLETRADGLDLGQLRHQLTTSSTIGRPSGRSGPRS
jgi:hypothetical protein